MAWCGMKSSTVVLREEPDGGTISMAHTELTANATINPIILFVKIRIYTKDKKKKADRHYAYPPKMLLYRIF